MSCLESWLIALWLNYLRLVRFAGRCIQLRFGWCFCSPVWHCQMKYHDPGEGNVSLELYVTCKGGEKVRLQSRIGENLILERLWSSKKYYHFTKMVILTFTLVIHHHHPSAAEQATTRFLHAQRSSANAAIYCSCIAPSLSPSNLCT